MQRQIKPLQKLVLASALGLLGWGAPAMSALPSSKQASPRQNGSSQTTQAPPPPPFTPPPNHTRSGGSLSAAATCTQGQESLTALVPASNPVLTTSEHPTFLFYVPYGAKDVQSGEFSVLLGPDEMTRVYRTQFTLPNTPGIVSLSLPNSPDSALVEGASYHWYFKLYCQDNRTATADLQVDGWVQRVAQTPERDRQINAATPEIWYDALAQLATRLQTSPQDSTLRDRWRKLLEQIGLAELGQAPLAGTVQPVEH
jgi:hypothetical protein